MPPDNINVMTVDVPPLTIEKARQVANEIRRTRVGGGVDRAYWPWVIETLCDEIENLRVAITVAATAGVERAVRSELDAVRSEKVQ